MKQQREILKWKKNYKQKEEELTSYSLQQGGNQRQNQVLQEQNQQLTLKLAAQEEKVVALDQEIKRLRAVNEQSGREKLMAMQNKLLFEKLEQLSNNQMSLQEKLSESKGVD